MKNIAIWKIILLTLVTFGFYSIYWFARNRNYLVANYNAKVPGWTWLLAIPVIYGIATITGFSYLIGSVFGASEVEASINAYNVAILFGTAVTALIYIWWLWKFSQPIQEITQGRLRVWLIVFLGILTGPLVIAFVQFYINRLGDNKKDEKYPISTGLRIVTLVLAILSGISLITTIATFESNNNEIKNELIKTKAGFTKIQDYSKRYNNCTTALATDFPGDLTEETKPKYLAASEACEKIQKEYQDSLNQYIKGEL